MSLNYREVDLILDELDLSGGRIDKINQPDRFSLFLEIYNKGVKQHLYICLKHGNVRLHEIDSKPQFPDYPPRFAQLLRARINGGRIISAQQPGGERIIRFIIKTQCEIYNLWIRLWSGNPNILLTNEDNIIIDTLFRKIEKQEIKGQEFAPDPGGVEKTGNRIRKIREYPSNIRFNQFIDRFYKEKDSVEDFSLLKERELKSISVSIKKHQLHLAKLNERKHKFTLSDQFKENGELILSNLHKMAKGDIKLVTENFFNDNRITEITLKEDKTPYENSEIYFQKYKKALKGIKIVREEIKIENNLINELILKKNKIEDSNSLERLLPLLEAKKIVDSKNQKMQIGLLFQSGNYRIQVGRNSKENDQILRRSARGNDMWLHVRDYPGGFVIIKSIKGKSIPLEALLDAANLALLYSSKKYKDKADVHYTEVKNLRRLKGGKEGLVIPHNEKNLSIIYDEKRIKKVQQKKSLLEMNSLIKDN